MKRPISAALILFPIMFVVMIFFGARYSPVFDLSGLFIRGLLRVPIKTRVVPVPPSPDGAWQLEFIVRQWTYHDASDMSSYDIVARKNGKPFQRGRNLDTNNWARAHLGFQPEWISNSVLAFHPKFAAAGTTVPLTVINATGRALPYVTLQTTPYYYLFELAPNARLQLVCHVPKSGDWIGWAMGPQPGQTRGMRGPNCAKQIPLRPADTPLRGITMTVRDQFPDVVFEKGAQNN